MNHRPQVPFVGITIDEDSFVTLDLLQEVHDEDDDPLRISMVIIGDTRFDVVPSGKVSFSPPLDFNGSLPVTFQVSDGKTSVAGMWTLTVRPVQDPVKAVSKMQGVLEDRELSFTLDATDVDGDGLTYTIVTPPAHGTLTGTAPNLSYTPSPDYFGADSVRFSVSDGHSEASGTVTLGVISVNDAPVATAQTLSLNEDSAYSFLLEGTDIDSSSLTYTVGVAPQHGVISGTGANRTYQPYLNYFGPDEFSFLVFDGALNSSLAKVTINVAAVDDPTTALPVTVAATEDAAVSVTLRGGDNDGGPLAYSTSTPAHGTLSGTGSSLTYTPALNYNGSDSFTYTVTADGPPATGTVTINIAAVNDAPLATDGTATTAEDSAVAIQLQGSDVDSTSLTYTVVAPFVGTVTGTPPNISFTPPANANGTRVLSFSVSDGPQVAYGTVTISVTPVNDAPTALADYVATDIDEPLEIAPLSNDSDIDGDALSLEDLSEPAHGSAVIEDGKILYTPDDDFAGIDELSYTAADAAGATSIATIKIGVGEFPSGAPLETLIASSAFGGYTGPDLMPTISNDGRYIAFQTVSPLVPEDTNTRNDVYLYDRGKRTLELMSKSSAGIPADSSASQPRLSGDGRYLVFASSASNLVANDTNGTSDVFRRDLRSGEVLLVSLTSSGGPGNATSFSPVISDDGTRIAFVSSAFNMIPGDANGANDIFLRDLTAGTTTRVSSSVSGFDADFASFFPAMSGDGKYVAFGSNATNLVVGDSNGFADVFVRDLSTGTTTRVSVSTNGTQGNSTSNVPSISKDGRFIAFASTAGNLVPNGQGTYVRDALSGTTTAPSFSSQRPTLSGDGRYVVGHSASTITTLADRFGGGQSTLTPPAGVRWNWPALSGNGRYVAVVDTVSGAFIVMPNPR